MNSICRIKNIFIITLLILNFASCTKEETIVPNQQIQKGSISFGSFIGNILTKEKLDLYKTYKLGIPECSNENPKYIRIALKNSKGSWVTGINGGDHFIEIKVNSDGVDLNKDGKPDSWFTQDINQISLPVDQYTLEYFAVLDGIGPDATILYIAPRANDVYGTSLFQNFVNAPLPLEINIREGVKHYVPVEVLCYDLQFAFAYGYIFFDFNNTPLINICSKGLICNDGGNKNSAKYRFKIWTYSGADIYNETNLLVNAINFTATENGLQLNPRNSDGLCFPLPDSPKEDIFYAEIYLVGEDEEEILIRKGAFTDTFWKEQFMITDNERIYEFEEGCCDHINSEDVFTDVANHSHCN